MAGPAHRGALVGAKSGKFRANANPFLGKREVFLVDSKFAGLLTRA
jgi:hypothetical protein